MRRDGIVFLDFDGVLNSSRCHALPHHRGCIPLCPVYAARVERVCTDGDAAIVLVTSWLVDHTPDELAALLRAVGVTAPVVDALTVAESSNRYRGEAVRAWLGRRMGSRGRTLGRRWGGCAWVSAPTRAVPPPRSCATRPPVKRTHVCGRWRRRVRGGRCP